MELSWVNKAISNLSSSESAADHALLISFINNIDGRYLYCLDNLVRMGKLKLAQEVFATIPIEVLASTSSLCSFLERAHPSFELLSSKMGGAFAFKEFRAKNLQLTDIISFEDPKSSFLPSTTSL